MLFLKKGQCFTQEVEFGRKVESITIWYKSVVALVLWFDLINGQFMVPKEKKEEKKPFYHLGERD